jgi:siroheme synthase
MSGGTPAAIVENATEPDQRVIRGTLEILAAQATRGGVKSPAVVFVGAHAVPRARLAWFEQRR